jgi:protein-S-isoprenylcysteine O-methyltransferase Ste14
VRPGGVRDPLLRPRTLILPPAPYAAALIGGWWLDRNVLPLEWRWGAANALFGWTLVGGGLLLFGWTLATLWLHRTTVNPYRAANSLCVGGPFRFSRNPIYLGDWFLLAGISLLLGTEWPLAFAPLIWFMIRYGVIRHEEAHLEAKFGDAYRDYKRQVRRWL